MAQLLIYLYLPSGHTAAATSHITPNPVSICCAKDVFFRYLN